MRRIIASKQTMPHAVCLWARIYLIPAKFSRYHQSSTLLAAGTTDSLLAQAIAATDRVHRA
jgi:hypothetical protein